MIARVDNCILLVIVIQVYATVTVCIPWKLMLLTHLLIDPTMKQ